MRRLLALPLVLLLALGLSACGDADTVAPSSSASAPAPSAIASTTPTLTPSPTPTPTPSAAPRRIEPPPVIALPPSGRVVSSTVPVDGVPVREGGRYDIYVQCLGELALWGGARAGDAREYTSEDDELGCGSDSVVGAVVARLGVGAERAVVLGVIEPDSQLPIVVRVPEGQPLSEAQRARFMPALAGVERFEIVVGCMRQGGTVQVGDQELPCMADGYVRGAVAIGEGGSVPAVVGADGFAGIVRLWPEGR
ncbi:hypothetical protein OVA14_05495 [Agrococcus sp. SL85]|uniref:hypothetical protein n=1 Tax=Agrococcus sp. SL85 TaxID=2995141 RepID=UPI00226D28C9|nr:hypothetical protein [Agrococcus sp. SL85]WAC67197.1 hypothetical protein OVA14_05495 [Agrococcus sp. SL85]